jgi:metallo-beta-lactamase family protein
LGRRLVEGRNEVKIFGVKRTRQAEVRVLNGFSAHADQKDLVTFTSEVRQRGPLSRVVLVHGEPKPQRALRELLLADGVKEVDHPETGARLDV